MFKGVFNVEMKKDVCIKDIVCFVIIHDMFLSFHIVKKK